MPGHSYKGSTVTAPRRASSLTLTVTDPGPPDLELTGFAGSGTYNLYLSLDGGITWTQNDQITGPSPIQFNSEGVSGMWFAAIDGGAIVPGPTTSNVVSA